MTLESDTRNGGGFPPTRMSVLAAMRSQDPEARARAWERLVEGYWRPVYKYLRLRFRKNAEQAEDLTQSFFLAALERSFFEQYEASRSRFRTFVRLCAERHAQNAETAGRAAKRGGQETLLSLDFEGLEEEIARLEPPAPDSVEAWFEREWRRSLFAAAVARLQSACAAHDQIARWELFRRYDLGEGGRERPSYAELAADLGITVTTVTNQLHAARKQLREIVLDLLRGQSGSEAEVLDDLAGLLRGARP